MDQRVVWLFGVVIAWITLRTLVRQFARVSDRQRRVAGVWTAGFRRSNRKRYLKYRRSPAALPVTNPVTPVIVKTPPHAFPHRWPRTGQWLDLSQDGRSDELRKRGLAVFHTPDDLAAWLNVPVNRLAWLAHRCTRGKPDGIRQSHYVYTWKRKRSGGLRLIESPKAQLKAVQQKILTGILNHLPISAAVHGFVTQRSIVTNAKPHLRAAVVVKFDLQDFYVTVKPGRVFRLYRRAGYSREAAIWLTRLTTSMMPGNLPIEPGDPYAVWRYRHRHLPQGAPTSPALANLVAFRLDQRLAGLARSFGAVYTRYADDLTFSGDENFGIALRTFLQLVEQIIRAEGFQSNISKRQVLRRHQRQIIAGVVVNDRPNYCRKDYDRLKAVLHLCLAHGPSSQNRESHPDFAAHLRGKVAHVAQLNPGRAKKLQDMYARINWGQ